jgi:toxin FitB
MVLDTNVISELIRPRPAPEVLDWFGRQRSGLLATTVISEAELRNGARRLPAGQRRSDLQVRIERSLATLRILELDRACTAPYAGILAARRARGRPLDAVDAFIAAICARHALPIVTRNTSDFEGCGIAVIDPWTA